MSARRQYTIISKIFAKLYGAYFRNTRGSHPLPPLPANVAM